MIEFSGVTKRFGETEALTGVDLSIPEGCFYGLLGPNGAGKSTLMNVLTGILLPDGGSVKLGGEERGGASSAVRRKLGLVPQNIAVYPQLNCLQNLKLFGNIYGMKGRTIRERGEQLLHEVGLWDRRKDTVKDFSGGMKRRLNLAASLLHDPSYLLCDEPTVGIDPQSRNAIFDFLESQRDRGLTVIYTTHYMEEAERLCDRIAIIDHGRIIAEGTRRELVAKMAAQPELRLHRAEGSADLVEATIEDGYVWSDEGDTAFVATLPDDAKLSALYSKLEELGLGYEELEVRQPSLENLFLHLTGRSLRE